MGGDPLLCSDFINLYVTSTKNKPVINQMLTVLAIPKLFLLNPYLVQLI